MAKLVRLNREYWSHDGFGHWCPGCGCGHEIAVGEKNASGASWTFDGNAQSPTFSPSINCKWGKHADPKCDHEGGVCHYFIRAGKIEFCGDSTHCLKGKTVDLPDIPDSAYISCERVT